MTGIPCLVALCASVQTGMRHLLWADTLGKGSSSGQMKALDMQLVEQLLWEKKCALPFERTLWA